MRYYDDDFDYDKLIEDLQDYYGTASMVEPFAMADLVATESVSKDELLKMMAEANLDEKKYIKR